MSDSGIPPLPAGESPAPESPIAAPTPAAPPAASFPEDMATPWDTLDLVVLFVYSLGMLYLLTNLMAVLAIVRFGVPANQIERFSATNAGFVVCRQILWFGLILLFLYAVVHRRTPAPFWRTIGWRKLRWGEMGAGVLIPLLLLGGVLLALGAEISSQFYETPKNLPIEALFATRRGMEYLMAFGILVAPLAEETVFRGYVYPVLARKFGIITGIALTGILFGLVHVPQLWGGWGQIATLVGVGMALTAVRAATHSVFASYLVHLGYNGFLFAGFFIPPDVLRRMHM
jgi:membrane protease YdiL (CAAX protease family)